MQHLTGTSFDTTSNTVEQDTMSADVLRQSANAWGSRLAAAGINVDLTPVLGTVIDGRTSNVLIGTLNRDLGLDAAGNAERSTAIIKDL